jgi:molybdenum cofactor biosynthesis protein MoaC
MKAAKEILKFEVSNNPNFKMIDVGRKRPTRRRAVACGKIKMNREAFEAVRDGTLPKGNVLALAEAAGIMGAKKAPDLIPMCHTLPLDQVTIHCDLNATDHSVTVYAQAAAFAKTGVEMEALAGVNAALLTIWDLTKGTDPNLSIEGVRLLVKTGGKSGNWISSGGIPAWLEDQLPSPQFLEGKKAAVLVMSDRAARGEYADESGACLKELLADAGAEITAYEVVPDHKDNIAQAIVDICNFIAARRFAGIWRYGAWPARCDTGGSCIDQRQDAGWVGRHSADREPALYRHGMAVAHDGRHGRRNACDCLAGFAEGGSGMLGGSLSLPVRCTRKNKETRVRGEKMKIIVQHYGAFRNLGDNTLLEISLPTTIGIIRTAMAAQLEGQHSLLVGDSAIANDTDILPDAYVIEEPCVLSILPPVCGG